jgi:hypothetical protein
MEPRRRKLLVATVGVATVSYVLTNAACKGSTTSGNLVAPPPPDVTDAGEPDRPPISGNLPAPPDVAVDTTVPGDTSDAAEVTPDRPPISGNLPAPPPSDVPNGG